MAAGRRRAGRRCGAVVVQDFGLARADPVQGLDRQRGEPRTGLVRRDGEGAAGQGTWAEAVAAAVAVGPMPTLTSIPRRDRVRMRSTSPSRRVSMPWCAGRLSAPPGPQSAAAPAPPGTARPAAREPAGRPLRADGPGSAHASPSTPSAPVLFLLTSPMPRGAEVRSVPGSLENLEWRRPRQCNRCANAVVRADARSASAGNVHRARLLYLDRLPYGFACVPVRRGQSQVESRRFHLPGSARPTKRR